MGDEAKGWEPVLFSYLSGTPAQDHFSRGFHHNMGTGTVTQCCSSAGREDPEV